MCDTTIEIMAKQIAELEAALRVIIEAWHLMPPTGLDPMVPAIENAERVLRKSGKDKGGSAWGGSR